MAVGLPVLWTLQRALGADRPSADEPTPHWRPFATDHAASGHAFIGAVPWLNAARAAGLHRWKPLLLAGSTLAGWSRLNDRKHYLSQVWLGWFIAWQATNAVGYRGGRPRRRRRRRCRRRSEEAFMLTIRRLTPAARWPCRCSWPCPSAPRCARSWSRCAGRRTGGRGRGPRRGRPALALRRPERRARHPGGDGVWERLPDGSRRWRLDVESPGALTLNLGFTVFWLPRGATLTCAGPPGRLPDITFDDGDNADHGQLWTPGRARRRAGGRADLPAGVARRTLLELGFVNSGYRFFGETPGGEAGPATSTSSVPRATPGAPRSTRSASSHSAARWSARARW